MIHSFFLLVLLFTTSLQPTAVITPTPQVSTAVAVTSKPLIPDDNDLVIPAKARIHGSPVKLRMTKKVVDEEEVVDEAEVALPTQPSQKEPEEDALLEDDDDDIDLPDEDEDDLKELASQTPIGFKDSIPTVNNPLIQTAEERNAPDQDPGNTAAFPRNGGGFQDQEKIAAELLKDDGSYIPLTPEQIAQKKQVNEAERNKIMGAALIKEKAKTAHAKKRDDIFEVNLKGLKEAGVDITKDGFGFTGKRYFWTDQYVRLTFALNLGGLLAQGYMNELALGPLKVSGLGPDGVYGTDDDGVIVELRIDKKKQRFMASGMIDLMASMARCDIIFGTDAFTFFTNLKILKEFEVKFLAESRGKGKNLDFVVLGAFKNDFLKFIETLGAKAIGQIADFTADGVKELREQIMKLKVVIKGMKKAQKKMGKEFMKNERSYKKKTRHAEKILAPLRKTVRTIEKQVSKLKKQIWSLRRKFIKGREKSLSGLKTAVNKVNSLKNEVNSAKRALKRAKRATKWYKPWTYAVVAAQAIRVAVVEASRWAAEKVLKGLMGLINLWPIDATPPLPVLWTAYGGAVASLKTAHASLSAAVLASNPLAMKEMAVMAGIAIAMATNQIAIIGAQFKLFETKVLLTVAEAGVRTAGEAASAAVKTATQVAGALTPFTVVGASAEFSLRETLRGKLPTLGLNARVFGARRNIKLNLDLTNPETFITAFPKMLVDVIGGSGKSDDTIAKIESARLKYKDQFDALDKAKEKAENSKSAWQKKDKERTTETKRIQSENIKREATVSAIDTIKKNSGEFGQELDVKGFTNNPEKEVEIFDEKDTSFYTVGNRFNQYRWTDKWQLRTPDSGSVVFNATADRDIQIGFHTQSGEKIKERTFDVILGFHANKGSTIRNAKSELLAYSRDPIARIKKGGKENPQPFWISYHRGFVSCGHGNKPGEDIILEWQLTSPPPGVKFFSFSCHNNKIRYANIATKPAYQGPFGSRYSIFEGFNNFVWHDQLKLPTAGAATVTFKAKAARDIAIGLTNNRNNKHASYLASLGIEGNSLSSLTRISEDGQKYNRIAMTKDREALVQGDNEKYVDYWLTFNNGHFAVGSGSNPQENVLLEALEEKPSGGIEYLSFSSWDNSVEIRNIKIQPALPIPFGTTYSAVNRNLAYEWRDEWQFVAPGKSTVTWLAKGDEDMAIGLHTSKDSNQKNKTYDILVGANNNSRTVLRDHTGKELVDTNDLDAVIQEKNNYTPYWLSYDNGGPGKTGYIALGTGYVPGKNIVLEYEGVSEKISHFAFSNNKDFISYKKIKSLPLVPVPRGRHFTANKSNNRFHWRPEWKFPTPGEGIVVFQAQGSSDITVGLHTKAGAPDERTFDVIFGADANTRSVIRDHNKKVLRADKRRVSRIPNSSDMRPYWVWYSQKEGAISYGQGSVPGKQQIVKLALDAAPPISHFSLSSGGNLVTYKDIAIFAAGAAKLKQRAQSASARGDAINIPSRNGAYEWRDEWKLPRKDVGTILFSARTMDAVHLGLHTNPNANGTEKSYEVTFSNKQVAIRNSLGKRMQATIDKEHIIADGGNFFDYWVNFYKGQFVVGKGKIPGENIIIEWQDSDPTRGINYFSLTSKTQPARIRNISTTKGIRYSTGKRYTAVQKLGQFDWHDEWRLPQMDQGAVFFKAKAARDITIGLARDKQSGPIYVVTIGAENNTSTVITKGRPVKRIQGAVASDKEFLPYWLAYQRGTITIGRGNVVGEDIITTWYDPLPKSVIQYVSFSGGKKPVIYQDITIEKLQKKAFSTNSFVASGANKTFIYNEKWQLPENGGTLTFRAHGSENIRIGLQTDTGISKKDAVYEVAIGAQKNSATIIKSDGKTVAQTTKPTALLNGIDAPQPFWITYKDNHISIGSGSDPRKNMMLTWQDDTSSHSIKYFSFSSGKSTVKFANIKVGAYVKSGPNNSYTSRSKNGKYKVSTRWRLKEQNSATMTLTADAEKDIMLGFFDNTTKKVPHYEAIIGGDNNSAIILRKHGTEVARIAHSVESFLAKAYWFSHHHGVLTCGTGTQPGENQLITWQDRTKKNSINFFGLSSGSTPVEYSNIASAPGVKRSRSKYITALNRNGAMLWNNKWQLPVGKTITLDAHAKHADIYIGLKNKDAAKEQYSIRLGGWRNSRCVLMKEKEVVASLDKKMNTTNAKKVWITCVQEEGKHHIIVGTGVPGHKVLLDWTDNAVEPAITHLGLSSGKTTVTYSNIRLQEAVMPISKQERAAIEAKQQAEMEAKAARIREQREETEALSIDEGVPSLPV